MCHSRAALLAILAGALLAWSACQQPVERAYELQGQILAIQADAGEVRTAPLEEDSAIPPAARTLPAAR